MKPDPTATAPSAGNALRHAFDATAVVRAPDTATRVARGPNRPLARTKTPYRAQPVAARFRCIATPGTQDKAQPQRSQSPLSARTESITCACERLGTRLALFSPRLGRMDDYPEMLAMVRALARYLRANPNSSDTAEGIATWWFREQTVVDGRALLDALDWMRARGLVEMLSANSTGERYRCIASADELDGVLHELSRRRLT
ncbi:hypothetical protein LVB77_16365 [Lysobacter sp. 5GHs7-4]|uniref:hypothetical protein n=1 Tax=Lysobacter sp. 5GHs7-4 TaxID=2904253 RepID=UPI001E3F792F|nr:hypothetical protein [Lysobacter sp. 5GHs7-4]UHQ22226.1 hypothetical protein LVB77_16365 [Lysobacter sp. 5GHs7-4]